MKELFYTDISELKEFKKWGDVFTLERTEPTTGRQLWKRVGDSVNYEVIIPVKHKNPDGSIVHTYPSTEQWGVKGFSVPSNMYAEAIIEFLLTSPDLSPQARHEHRLKLYNEWKSKQPKENYLDKFRVK